MIKTEVVESTKREPGWFCVERIGADEFKLYAIDESGKPHKFDTWTEQTVTCLIGDMIRIQVNLDRIVQNETTFEISYYA